MVLLAFDSVDLLAFFALALCGLIAMAVVVGLGLWLRQRARRPGESGYYSGL